VEKVEG
jgi:activator of HSP90 ATPase